MSKYIRYIAIIYSIIFATTMGFAAPASDGKEIFTTRCTSCHNVNKELTGPALANIDQRRSIDWIIKFVRSPLSVVKGGDTYAVNLYNKYNKIVMPDHPDLKDEDIRSIVEYIKSESKQVSAEKPPFVKPGKMRPAYLPLSLAGNSFFFIGFSVLVFLIVFIMCFAVEVKSMQRRLIDENRS